MTDLSINDPGILSPNPSNRSSADASPHQVIPRQSLPDLRASTSSNYSTQSYQKRPPAIQSPYLNATHLPPTLEDEAGMLQPPLSSRPSSRVGRPESRGLEEGQENSRGGSRAASPSIHRPLTPNTLTKAKRRRSWSPGRSTFEVNETQEAGDTARAWIFTPHEKIHYDSSSLTRFQPVSNFSNGEGHDIDET